MIKAFITSLTVIVCQTTDNPLVQYLQADALFDCPVLDLRNICVERCEDTLLECILDCNNNSACFSECIRIETDCIGHCPCELFCLEGCTGCENPVCQCEEIETNDDWNKCLDDNSSILGRCIYACDGDRNCDADCNDQFRQRQLECPCEENCIGGCPCPNYSCTETTTSPHVTTTSKPDTTSTTLSTTTSPTTTSPTTIAVLILSTAANVPMIVDFDGNVNENLTFEFGEDATALHGCGATLNGEFWYFGDNISGKKVSKIVGCQLVRQPDMVFDLSAPACNTFLEPTPKVLLCFDHNDDQVCHSFDGENYHLIESSKFSHAFTYGLANYKGQALTTGCNWGEDCSFATEIFDMNTLKWSDGPDFPFGYNCISRYSTANSPDAAYIIGGLYTEDLVAEFRDDQWRQLDDLNKGRYAHGSITIGARTMIVGGFPWGLVSLETEVWELENGNNKVISPALDSHLYGIGLYAVDFNFCSN